MGEIKKISYFGIVEIFKDKQISLTGSETSDIFKIESNAYFGLWYKAVSASGTPNLLIQYEMSYDTDESNFVIPVGVSNIETNLTSETAQVKSFAPPPMAYIRFKVTGNAANPSDTVLTMYLFVQ